MAPCSRRPANLPATGPPEPRTDRTREENPAHFCRPAACRAGWGPAQPTTCALAGDKPANRRQLAP
eukprot:11203463-Lingulodinium_polyedra.AAC.1